MLQIFCLAPLPLPQPIGDVGATAATTPVNFGAASKIAARKHSVCSVVHPSPLLFAKQVLSVWWVTSP
jgi:hypothetical protein